MKQQEEAKNASGTPDGATGANEDWFFDMIIGFLRSPRWKTPIMSFIDEHCVVFDDEDENKLEFTKVHQVSQTQAKSGI